MNMHTQTISDAHCHLSPVMTRLLWLVLWVTLLPPSVSSAPDHCSVPESDRSRNVSPLLESLQCVNDYESYIYCVWSPYRNTSLWLHGQQIRQCMPYRPPSHDGTVHCRIETRTWAIGISHTFFFLKNETPAACSSAPHGPVQLSQRLRARPPLDLSTRRTGDGGTQISWSSPYPPSSSLSNSLTYQLSYRTDAQDTWETLNVTSTSMKLEKHLLLPSHRYKAKVRTRASVGQWSRWSAVVTWDTPDDAGRPTPILHCVLDRETKVICSWAVSRELAHFVSYQLYCQHNHTARSERCCAHPTVGPELAGSQLTFSCWLSVADPASLLLKLLPAYNTKTFDPNKHIRPNPPKNVKLQEKRSSWVVEWTNPRESLPDLYYEVCYCRTQSQEPCTCEITYSLHQVIPDALLLPSQPYQVKVRSLVDPGEGSTFEGIPSEWTEPQTWTSHAGTGSYDLVLKATWSVTGFLYFLISLFVAALFLMFYFSFPTCQRRAALWADSVPSPEKSKILAEIKSAASRPLSQPDDMSICKVLHFDNSVSTCSSNASLWPMKDIDKLCVEPNEGVWKCDNMSTLNRKVDGCSSSSINFSGPYIFCQTPQTSQTSADAKREVEEHQASSGDSPSPAGVAPFGEGYVCLPNRSVSKSTPDLASHSGAHEQVLQCPDTLPWMSRTSIGSDVGEPTNRDQPPVHTSTPLGPWPQGGHVQASGYCFLPQPK